MDILRKKTWSPYTAGALAGLQPVPVRRGMPAGTEPFQKFHGSARLYSGLVFLPPLRQFFAAPI